MLRELGRRFCCQGEIARAPRADRTDEFPDATYGVKFGKHGPALAFTSPKEYGGSGMGYCGT